MNGVTMYLPNRDVRPTGSELAEFIDAPAAPDAHDGVSMGDRAREQHIARQLRFLRELEEESAWIAGDVLSIGYGLWAIHGVIAVDREVLMAEFESYDDARSALDQLDAEVPHRRGLA
jgi:hypothetical protein